MGNGRPAAAVDPAVARPLLVAPEVEAEVAPAGDLLPALEVVPVLDDDLPPPSPMPALTVTVHDQIAAAAHDLDPVRKIDALTKTA